MSDTRRTPIAVNVDGIEHKGFYWTENHCLIVSYGLRQKATQSSAGADQSIAKIMLRELITETRN